MLTRFKLNMNIVYLAMKHNEITNIDTLYINKVFKKSNDVRDEIWNKLPENWELFWIRDEFEDMSIEAWGKDNDEYVYIKEIELS